LQATWNEKNTTLRNLIVQLGEQLNQSITNVAVSFMNNVVVAVVVKVLANFQVRIVLDL